MESPFRRAVGLSRLVKPYLNERLLLKYFCFTAWCSSLLWVCCFPCNSYYSLKLSLDRTKTPLTYLINSVLDNWSSYAWLGVLYIESWLHSLLPLTLLILEQLLEMVTLLILFCLLIIFLHWLNSGPKRQRLPLLNLLQNQSWQSDLHYLHHIYSHHSVLIFSGIVSSISTQLPAWIVSSGR